MVPPSYWSFFSGSMFDQMLQHCLLLRAAGCSFLQTSHHYLLIAPEGNSETWPKRTCNRCVSHSSTVHTVLNCVFYVCGLRTSTEQRSPRCGVHAEIPIVAISCCTLKPFTSILYPRGNALLIIRGFQPSNHHENTLLS